MNVDSVGIGDAQTAPPASETIWILGGGQFGKRAAVQLRKRSRSSTIVVIDPHPDASLPKDVEVVTVDGIEWLSEHFCPGTQVSKIIPALPVHMIAEWLRKIITEEGGSVYSPEIPNELFPHRLHPLRLKPGQFVVSHANFICPLNCSEPDDLCTYTQQPRPTPIYRILRRLDCGRFTPLILRSRQFAPGIGGFIPEDLWGFQKNVRALEGAPLLIGTACKCHGIIDSFCHRNNLSS
ncbi:MAG: hypothetical protein COA36_06190 [Desulfotalea sp.]|nr:MAG: hypothetical protein COA36_06190 [Desulfotalea sp.]